MEIEKKRSMKELWDDIDIPVIFLILWGAVSLFFPLSDFITSKILQTVIGLGVTIIAFGYVGFHVAKEKQKDASRAGAYAGIIAGFVGALITLIVYYAMPGIFDPQIAEAVLAGADEAMVRNILRITTFASLVFSPIINGLIGAFISWASYMIFRNKLNKKK